MRPNGCQQRRRASKKTALVQFWSSATSLMMARSSFVSSFDSFLQFGMSWQRSSMRWRYLTGGEERMAKSACGVLRERNEPPAAGGEVGGDRWGCTRARRVAARERTQRPTKREAACASRSQGQARGFGMVLVYCLGVGRSRLPQRED